jgi:hypothetical protein
MLCHMKVPNCRWPHNMPYRHSGDAEVQLYPHTTLVPEALHASCFIPMKDPVPLCRRFGGPWGWSRQARKILSPPEFDPWIVQAAASYYIDCAIPANKHQDISQYFKANHTEHLQNIVEQTVTLYDFRLPPWSRWDLHSSGILCGA